MTDAIPPLLDARLLVGEWFAMHLVGGLGMLQLRFSEDGTFWYTDYSRGEKASGTYQLVGGELLLSGSTSGTLHRLGIVELRSGRLILRMPWLGIEVEFRPDRPVP